MLDITLSPEIFKLEKEDIFKTGVRRKVIKIVNTLEFLDGLFEDGSFQLENWKSYINSIYEGSQDLFLEDVRAYIETGKYTFEDDFLPILNNVYKNPKLEVLEKSFKELTDKLNEKIISKYGKELDLDLVLYMGLCNAAGWVTEINGRDVIMLGVEKILELAWYDIDRMKGLIYHELGHAYHKQYGKFFQECDSSEKEFIWQLFTEGVAMYFEQSLVGDYNYYHQDKGGWKNWCDKNFKEIFNDFNKDLPDMSFQNQRYFGDWADYKGWGDVGYYLGTRFIHYLRKVYIIDEIIDFSIDEVSEKYMDFIWARR